QALVDRLQFRRTHLASRHVAAQRLPAILHLLDFEAVFRRPIEWCFVQLFVWNRNSEARTEQRQLFVVDLLLLVRDVLAFAALAKSITFDGLCKNDRRRSFVLHRRAVGRMHLDWIVSA